MLVSTGIFIGYHKLVDNPPYELILNVFDSLSTYNIDSMDMEVEYLDKEAIIDVNTTMQVSPDENARSFLAFALSDGFKINKSLINGKEARVWRVWYANFIYLPQGLQNKNFTLELEYSGAPSQFYKKHTGGYIDHGGLLLTASSVWYPLMSGEKKDPPEVKIKLLSSREFTGVAGGEVIEEQKEGKKNIRVIKNKGVSLLAFHNYHEYIYNGVKKLRIYTPPDLAHHSGQVARMADEIIKVYERYLASTDNDTLTIAFIDREHIGRYNQDMIVMGEGDLRRLNRNPDDLTFYSLLAHEIGHCWWHSSFSLSTLKGNQWYVEGFTEYASLRVTAARYGMDSYTDELAHYTRVINQHKEELKPLTEYTYWEYSNIPYYKGTLMLESLRRIEGEEKVFKFMEAVKESPEQKKTIESLTAAAHEVFGNDYSTFFEHWLYGSEAVNINTVEVTSPVALLENMTKEEALSTLEKQHTPLIAMAKNNSALNINDMISLTDKWVEVNKVFYSGEEEWKLERFLEDYNCYWALVSGHGERSHYDFELELYEGNNGHYWPSVIKRSFDRDKNKTYYLLRWGKNDDKSRFVDYRICFSGQREQGVEFSTTLQDSMDSKAAFPGKTIEFDRVKIFSKVSFGLLETTLEFKVTGLKEYRPVDIVGFSILLPDKTIIPVDRYSTRIDRNSFTLTVNLPGHNKPLPLGIRVGGIVMKKDKEILTEFMTGGTIWVGLADKVANWPEPVQDRIVFDNGLRLIKYDFSSLMLNQRRNVQASIITSNGKPVPGISIINPEKKEINLKANLYLRKISKSNYIEIDETAGHQILDFNTRLDTDKDGFSIPFHINDIEAGFYRLDIESDNFNFPRAGELFIADGLKLVKKEVSVRKKINYLASLFKSSQLDKVNTLLADVEYTPYWYKYLKELAGREDWRLEIKEVNLNIDYRNQVGFIYKVRVYHQDEDRDLRIRVIKEGNEFKLR